MKVIQTCESDIKERLSLGIVTLVAARAGCQVCEPPLDRVSTDAIISPVSGPKVQIDAQLKATVNLNAKEEYFTYDLDVKNYDDLRQTIVSSPQILIVLDLHEARGKWLNKTGLYVRLDRRAYWLSLRGMPPTKNKKKIRVKIPKRQVFNATALEKILSEHYRSLVDRAEATT